MTSESSPAARTSAVRSSTFSPYLFRSSSTCAFSLFSITTQFSAVLIKLVQRDLVDLDHVGVATLYAVHVIRAACFVNAHDARLAKRVVILGAADAVASQKVSKVEAREVREALVRCDQLAIHLLLYLPSPWHDCVLGKLDSLLLRVAV